MEEYKLHQRLSNLGGEHNSYKKKKKKNIYKYIYIFLVFNCLPFIFSGQRQNTWESLLKKFFARELLSM